MVSPSGFIPYLLFPAAITVVASERIQVPDALWKTIKTEHYQIHYPANPRGDFEAFAFEVASKIEGIHAVVVEWVGYEAKGPVDVIIQDPMMEANGAAIPLLKRPILLFWKTEPERDSGIGHYNNWVDLLVTHELVHLHHLMRPQNAPTLSEKLVNFPIGPVTLKAPRMVTEGYATLLEGRITGSGRPYSAYRAAVIRQWAIQGKLPSYEDVSRADSDSFRGSAMAYLLGSAYLDWLERQFPDEPDILQKFWKQLASKKRRSYKKSFVATFGISPEDSYDRWRAEVTYDAISQERSAKAGDLTREGALVARFDGEITDLALSPDGTKLMARVLSRKKPGLKIWDITNPSKPKNDKKKGKKQEKPDPNEVDDRKPEFTEPMLLTTIGKRNGTLPRRAWWSGENQVTYELKTPNGEGVLAPRFMAFDVKTKKHRPAAKPSISESVEYTWKDYGGVWNIIKSLPNGQEQQLTRTLSSAWQPAPSPDGKWLYYVQLGATGCEIRVLDLSLPALDSAPLLNPETMLVKDTILSPSDTQSLLPLPSDEPMLPNNYSVWDSHQSGLISGIQDSPSSTSLQLGWGGSDILGRLNWFAVGAFPSTWRSGNAVGPRGAAAGIAYRGWRFAPSLQAFSSLENPSYQRYVPVAGFNRERRGAELAFTWRRQGTVPVVVKPFASWESVEFTDAAGADASRRLAGVFGSIAAGKGIDDWNFRIRASFQGAIGQTEIGKDDVADWKLIRAIAGLHFYSPLGTLALSAEDGRIHGDYTALDAFSLGGHNSGLVPSGLDMNRVQQPALPAYLQTGNRMRHFRADFGYVFHAYYDRAAVWHTLKGKPDYLTVYGIELRLDDLLSNPFIAFLRPTHSISIGLHRPQEGVMKDRTIFTVNFSINL